MYICVCIYIYIYKYVYLSIYLSISLSLSIYIYIYIYIVNAPMGRPRAAQCAARMISLPGTPSSDSIVYCIVV